MPRTSRVELNRAAFATIDLAIADGLFAVAKEVIDVAVVPDATPIGQGLIEGGGAIAYLGGKKVGGTTIGGRAIAKPRSLKVKGGEPVAIAGFGFPARFVELGTVDTHANPFLSRAVAFVEPQADVILSNQTRRRLAGIRDPRAVARFG